MTAGRITASHVGVAPSIPSSQRRTCSRCGVERVVRKRTGPVFMCGDCKLVDPALARRLGLK